MDQRPQNSPKPDPSLRQIFSQKSISEPKKNIFFVILGDLGIFDFWGFFGFRHFTHIVDIFDVSVGSGMKKYVKTSYQNLMFDPWQHIL